MRLLLSFFLLLSCSFVHADEFLDPAVAFRPAIRALDAQTVEVRYEIARGYYLYRDKFRFSAEGVQVGAPQLPKGKEKHDDNFGTVEVYYKEATIRLPIEHSASGPQSIDLKLVSQGCAEAGICYPPQTQTLSVTLPAPGQAAAAAATPASASAADASALDESGGIATRLRHAGFWANLAFFFVAGLGLSLTPCVFPMVPILSGIIVGQGHKVSRGRGLALALAYVLGMAVTYALAGVAAGLSGTLVSGLLQNAWVLGGFALVFVLLAGSMFGFYELQLPSALQSRLSEEAGHLAGGRGPAVFVMGALSALIVGPCVAAPLAGALIYIGQTGDALLGGTSLFVMALGMGVPLIAVGLSAGALLPKAGAWMNAVKKAFGFMLLGTALWLLSPVLPPAMELAAWGALLIVPAVFLHAIDPLPPHAQGSARFWKGIGVMLLVAGIALLIGALSGSRSVWQPLAGLRGTVAAATAEARPDFQRVVSVEDLDRRLKAAQQPVMLDFYADWCIECKKMERETFSHSTVQSALAGVTLLQADVTAMTPDDRALLARFSLYGPPGILFFDEKGREIPGLRVVGFQDAPTFAKVLAKLRS